MSLNFLSQLSLQDQTMPLKDWGQTAQQLAILFPDRFKLFD